MLEIVADTYNFKVGEPDPSTMKIPDGFTRSRGIITRPSLGAGGR